jgi:hypothetical protein
MELRYVFREVGTRFFSVIWINFMLRVTKMCFLLDVAWNDRMFVLNFSKVGPFF